jgi:uncharacterized membrane protein YgdD (TMEM256/DUF423 family)
MHKNFLITAAILGAVSVAVGAFGAHALKEILSEQSFNTYEVAVRYQFYHVLALALTGVIYGSYQNKRIVNAGRLFIAGIVLFSGSLYLLISLPDLRWLGAVTPLGGACFIGGWLLLAAGFTKRSL